MMDKIDINHSNANTGVVYHEIPDGKFNEMGLHTTHGCFSGSYLSFQRWRNFICKIAGYGDLQKRENYIENGQRWPKGDILIELLNHSDCDGSIRYKACERLADRLEDLMITHQLQGENKELTLKFVKGLRLAAKEKKKVEFH